MFKSIIENIEEENNKHGLGACDCKTEFVLSTVAQTHNAIV